MKRPEYAGAGFLMRHGYSVVWCGWQGDLIDKGDNIVARLPFALTTDIRCGAERARNPA